MTGAGARLAAVVAVTALGTVSTPADGGGDNSWYGRAADSTAQVGAGYYEGEAVRAAADPAASPWVYERIARCGMDIWIVPAGEIVPSCMGIPIECADGATPLAPLNRRPTGSTDPAAWEIVTDWTCPELAVPAFTAQDLRDLLIVSGSVDLEPAAGPLLVNMANVVHTDAATQTFAPTLLGFAFEVEVTPISYIWDFADGTAPLRTTDAGSAYRSGSGDDLDGYLTHAYAQPGTHAITLTTTWSGRYRVVGRTDWQDVIGTATTTATSRTFDVVERHANLVSGDCADDPAAPGCG
ncbi:PKD domain-containing protein [Cellulomonas soli]|uniref:PKD domain-containing protein n=1 Tax=Cellulomonas soli TaxID=931535 RepID=A0A512PGF1_9CELL|nr:PKD domain-containing protein [Cellulomonas soli]NYI58097.1 hypothetical protein [Cellulomonas soli]GEP70232.1 hypothetical protein CSO01_29470 [Cellulomonas soli]